MSYENLVLNAMYEQIIRKISGGLVLGIPVNINNLESLVVAAYCLGRNEEMQDDIKRLELV